MEATKKMSQIFARTKKTKNPTFSHVEQQVGTALVDIVSHFDGDNKRVGSFIEVNRAIEIPNGK